jgi:hypothetical protein
VTQKQLRDQTYASPTTLGSALLEAKEDATVESMCAPSAMSSTHSLSTSD